MNTISHRLILAAPSAPAPTMTSLELVDLINSMREAGKAELLHKNFMVKIESHPGIDSAKFLAQYKDSTGRTLKCYALPKREAELMVMSESLAVQAKVYDRMVELEVKVPVLSPANMSRLQLLEMAMQAEQERLLLEQTVAVLEVKSDRLDRIELADGSFCITDTAKLLQVQPKKLFGWMQAHDWIYRRTGGPGWLGYQDKLKSGVLEHKVTTVHRSDGTEKVTEQVRVTAKGLVALTAKIEADPKQFGSEAINPRLPGVH